MNIRASDERGITLLELMMAMILLAIALVGLAAAFPLAMFGVTDGGLQTTAVGLAQTPIEVAKRIPFANLGNLTTATPPGVAEARATVTGFAGFEREVLVTTYTPAGCSAAPCTGSCASGSCKQIESRVYFIGQQGEVRTTLTALVTQ